MKKIMQLVWRKKKLYLLIKLFLECLPYQKSNSKNTRNVFPIEFSRKSIVCSIETLIEKIKPAVTQKYDFGYRDKLVLMAPFNFWDYRHSDARNKLVEFSIESLSLNMVLLIEALIKVIK